MISINDVTTEAGEPATFTVTSIPPSASPITLTYATSAGSASAGGGDYKGVPSAPFTIPANATSATLAIQTIDKEGNNSKTFSVVFQPLRGIVFQKASGRATITYKPAPAVPIIVGVTLRTIQANENATAILSEATDKQTFKLSPGPHTLSPVQVATKVAFSLDATGATVTWKLPTTPGSPESCFKTMGKGASISGGTWITNAVLFALFGATTISDCVLEPGATQFAKIDEQLGFDGTGSVIQGCTVGETNSVGVYSSRPCQILNNIIGPSIGEIPLRISPTSAGARADDVMISGNTITSIGGSNLKGSCELRELGARGQFLKNILSDYLRVGQGSATSANEYADGLLIQGNTWAHLPPTTIKLMLMLMAGVTATVDSNDFAADESLHVATVSSPSGVTFKNNKRHPTTPGIRLQPQLWNPVNNRPGGIPIDGGGNT